MIATITFMSVVKTIATIGHVVSALFGGAAHYVYTNYFKKAEAKVVAAVDAAKKA